MSSVAYAIEAALRALDGDLALLIPAMSAVLLIIALVVVNYQQLIARYPRGGGASAATGEAFGESRAPRRARPPVELLRDRVELPGQPLSAVSPNGR